MVKIALFLRIKRSFMSGGKISSVAFYDHNRFHLPDQHLMCDMHSVKRPNRYRSNLVG